MAVAIIARMIASSPAAPFFIGLHRNRAGGIRTHDLLNPIQALYQAEPRPVSDLLEFNGTIANAIAILVPGSSRDRQCFSILNFEPPSALVAEREDLQRAGDGPKKRG